MPDLMLSCQDLAKAFGGAGSRSGSSRATNLVAIPVVDAEGRIVGIVSVDDILDASPAASQAASGG